MGREGGGGVIVVVGDVGCERVAVVASSLVTWHERVLVVAPTLVAWQSRGRRRC
jgi:hypothetical protein